MVAMPASPAAFVRPLQAARVVIDGFLAWGYFAAFLEGKTT